MGELDRLADEEEFKRTGFRDNKYYVDVSYIMKYGGRPPEIKKPEPLSGMLAILVAPSVVLFAASVGIVVLVRRIRIPVIEMPEYQLAGITIRVYHRMIILIMALSVIIIQAYQLISKGFNASSLILSVIITGVLVIFAGNGMSFKK